MSFHQNKPDEIFKEEEFNKFVEQEKDSIKVTEGIFAPWMMYKKEFNEIGGHDPIMHSCREDSDIFNRMLLARFKFIQPWNCFGPFCSNYRINFVLLL